MADGLKQFRRDAVKIATQDNVAVALVDLRANDAVLVDGEPFHLATSVAAKHKFALRDFSAGDQIFMYGVLVAEATSAIGKGAALTTRNTRHQSASFDAKSRSNAWAAPEISAWKGRTFQGYLRPDGQVGTRNYWLVVPLVFCENRNILALREAFQKELGISP